MIRWFRRRRPAPAPEPVTTQADILIAHAWGLTLTEWWALDDKDRAARRLGLARAPKFGVAS